MVNVGGTVAPRMLVLGRARVGGHVFMRGSGGANKEKFTMLVALAAHEIDAVEQLWLNDTPVTVDGAGWVQTAPYMQTRTESFFIAVGEVAPGEVVTVVDTPGGLGVQITVTSPKARIRAYLGAAGQTADAQVMADFPDLWNSAHRAQGTAYLVCEFFYDETAFPSGIPNVTATVRGARCFDPRTSTTVWTENPALHMRHLLTHPHFGKRAGVTAAEDARISAAANACDVGYNYGAGHVPMYRSGLVLPFGTAARDALDDLAQAMAGQWAYAAGEFHVRAGVYTAPVLALTEADLAVVQRDASGAVSQQGISISTHAARAEQFNTVTPRIWEQAQNYKQVVLAPVKGSALIAADGVELAQEVDLPAVFYGQQAQHVVGVMMRDARDPLTVSAPFKLRAYPLELFDTITLTLPRYGWAGKLFQVVGRQWTLGGAIALTLKETSAAIFQPDAAFVASGYADNTALPRPWDIAPPANLQATSGTAELIKQADGTIITRVRVTWSPIADLTLTQGGSVEVQWALPAATLVWTSATTSAVDTQLHLTGTPDGETILIRARSRNSLAVSDWGTQIAHAVIGKTAPPANVQAVSVSGATVTWTPVQEPDLAGYLLRFQYGENTWWDSAGPLHEGVITESPYTLERVPEGPCTVLVKAVDTSGNVSQDPVFSFYNFPGYSVSNILLSTDQHPTFPGTTTAGTLTAGELLANALDDFYSPPDGPMYLPSAEAMYLPSQYAAMAYEFAVTPADPGTLALQLVITGDYRVEFQTGGAEPMYEPVGDAMFSPVDEALFGTPSAWSLWPGSLEVDGSVQVRFRITLASGELRGEITEVTAVLDVPDITERLAAVAIASGGTRLPITRSYAVIKTVHLTVHSGATATSARIVDKNPTLGPLVQVINASGTAVAGTVDADVYGY